MLGCCFPCSSWVAVCTWGELLGLNFHFKSWIFPVNPQICSVWPQHLCMDREQLWLSGKSCLLLHLKQEKPQIHRVCSQLWGKKWGKKAARKLLGNPRAPPGSLERLEFHSLAKCLWLAGENLLFHSPTADFPPPVLGKFHDFFPGFFQGKKKILFWVSLALCPEGCCGWWQCWNWWIKGYFSKIRIWCGFWTRFWGWGFIPGSWSLLHPPGCVLDS